jgi:hypothetical protein
VESNNKISSLQSKEILSRLGITKRKFQWMAERRLVRHSIQPGPLGGLARELRPKEALLAALLFDVRTKLFPRPSPMPLRVRTELLEYAITDNTRDLWLVVTRVGPGCAVRYFASAAKALRCFSKMPCGGALIAVHELRDKLWPPVVEERKAKGVAA